MPETQTTSNGASVDEIRKLVSEVDQLNSDVDFWNAAIIVMMLVAATAAALLVVTQYKAFKKSGQLAAVQAALIDAKDRQLRGDLHAKDLQLRAELHAKDLDLRRELDQNDSDLAQTLREKDAKIEETRGENLETARKLEAERTVRLGLERSLLELQLKVADRDLTPVRSALIAALRDGPKCVVNFEVMANDAEAARFAVQIGKALREAGWEDESSDILTYREFRPFRGIELIVGSIEHSLPHLAPATAPPAAKHLLDALTSVGIEVKPLLKNGARSDVIELQIGSK